MIKFSLFVFLVFSLTFSGMTIASYAEPLRDCTWYEIIHYDNGDGTASTPTGTCIIPRNSVNPSSTGDDLTTAIPNWVNKQFVWYVDGEIDEKTLLTSMNWMFDNNLMYLSEKAAQEVNDLRVKVADQEATISTLRTLVTSQSMESGERIMQPEFGTGYDDKTASSGGNGDIIIIGSFASQSETASEIVGDILRKGGTTNAWEDGIAAFSEQGMIESTIPFLQAVVVLCNTEIDKKTQSISAELKILEKWLEIISEKQESDSSYDASDKLASDTTTKSDPQYYESDLDFITKNLSSIDQEIKALDTGIMVLEEKLSSVGDDAQLANIDLQNMLQKQQQTLQMMSNVSKMLHDTAMSSIRNMK